MDEWRIYTESGGLFRVDPGPEASALRAALDDCASMLSPCGEPPGLSTHWVDQMVDKLEAGERRIGHGDIWVLTPVGESVEIRMDVDEDDSDPIATVGASALLRCLGDLRAEVQARLAAGHLLDDRYWSQRNPS